MRRALHLLVAATIPLSAQAPAFARPASERAEAGQAQTAMTAGAIRALTKEAQAEAKGDNNALILALDRRVRARWGDFESFPVSIVRRQDITIYLATPFMSYRRALIEHLRMRESLAGVPWTDAAVVSVQPERLDAPDITRVVVARDGKEMPPLENQLRPMQFTNGNGDTASLHAGEVRFPMSAFAPGATVTVTAVPATGDPFLITLDDSQLRQLK